MRRKEGAGERREREIDAEKRVMCGGGERGRGEGGGVVQNLLITFCKIGTHIFMFSDRV